MRKLAVLLVGGMASSVLAAAAGKPPAKAPAAGAEAVGVSVAKLKPGDRFGQSLATGMQAGTRVAFRIARPDKNLIRMDKDASKLEAFADDKGTDLSKAGGGWGASWLLWERISDDGRTCTFTVANRKKTPAAGAKTLHVKAKIVLQCGSDVKTAEAKNVALKKGAAVAAGPFRMSIQEIRDGGFQSKMTVEFQSKRPFDSIRKLTFLDAAGKEIKSQKAGGGHFSFGKDRTYTRSFGLAKKVDAVTMRFEYYGKTETIAVPVDVKVGVGL